MPEKSDEFDPEGKTSAICKPLLKDQKQKLFQLLKDETENEQGADGGFITRQQTDVSPINTGGKTTFSVLSKL